jgi:hypothetical protein
MLFAVHPSDGERTKCIFVRFRGHFRARTNGHRGSEPIEPCKRIKGFKEVEPFANSTEERSQKPAISAQKPRFFQTEREMFVTTTRTPWPWGSLL